MASINYNDERFSKVEAEKNQAIQNTENKYNEMINSSDSYYQQQIDASKQWADKQTEIQNANTDFAIEKVEQAKDKANRDYTKEQKGAYADYQKATGQYGVNAEQLASQGLNQAGYSESVRTNMFNTYQNRYMAARESYNQAILNYDNSIKEAQLANNAALAQIAYEALQKQLELSLQGFQYKNQLVLQKLDAVNKEKDRYYQRWKDVESQINTENALAEQVRQFNEKMAEEKRQYNETMAFNKQKAAQDQANWEKQYALSRAKTYSSGSSGSSKKSSGSSKLSSSKSSGGSSSIKNNSSSSNSSKLSSNGTKVYQSVSAIYNSRNGSTARLKAQAKIYATDYLNKMYNNGKVNASDLRIIAQKLGL